MFHALIRPVTIGTALTLSLISPTLVGDRATVAQTQPAVSRAANTLLIAVDNNRLTQGMVDTYIAFLQFIAGERITTKEVQRITQLAVAEFRKNPESEVKNYKGITQEVSTLRQWTAQGDVVRLASRQKVNLIFNYFTVRKSGTPFQKEALKIVYRYNPTIAADSAAQLIVTELDIKARLASDDFIAKLAGVKPSTSESRAKFRQSVRRDFSKLDSGSKQFIASATTRYVTLRAYYLSLSPNERNQYAAEVKRRVSGLGVSSTARLAESDSLQLYTIGKIIDFQAQNALQKLISDYFSFNTPIQ